MKKSLGQISTLLVAIMVIMGFVVCGNVFAAETYDLGSNGYLLKTATGDHPASTVTINNQTVTDGMTVQYNDSVQVLLSWHLDNTKQYTADDTFTYTLPDNISFTNETGELMDGGTAVGSYTINGTSVTFKYYSDFVTNNENDIYGTLKVNGKITSVTTPNSNGGKASFEFPGIGKYDVDVDRDSSKDGVTVSKSDAQTVSGDAFSRDFIVKVTSTGTNSDVTVTDTMGSYLSYQNDSLKVYTDEGCTTAAQVTPAVTSQDAGFKANLGNMTDGQVYYVKYRVSIDKKAFANIKNWQDEQKNTVKGTSTEHPQPGNEDSKYVTINKNWVQKSGVNNNGTITWTITVNAGDAIDIKGTVIKDTLGDKLDAPTDIKVEESSDGGNNWADSSLKLTWDQLKNGYTFTDSTTKAYKITYSTKATDVSDMNQETRTNTATVTPWGTETDQTAKSDVGVGTNFEVLSKERTAVNGNTISWKSTIKVPDSGLTNVTYKDYWEYNQLNFDLDSVKISDDKGTDYSSVKPAATDKGFNIAFGDLQGPKTITITYNTTFETPTSSKTFRNTAQVVSDQKSDTKSADYNYTVVTNYISKKAIIGYDSDKKEQLDSSTGVMRWKFDVTTLLPKDAKSVTIVDTLPAGTKYVDGSVYTQQWYQNGKALDGVTVKDNGDGTITFTLAGDALETAKSAHIFIEYDTQITDFSKNENKDYINTGVLNIDGTSYPEVKADQWAQPSSLVKKDQNYTTSTAPYVKYTIKFNPAAIDLDSSSSTVTVKDTLGSALDFDMTSLKVNGEALDKGSYAYDEATRTVTMTLPDQQSLEITYQAMVNLDVKGNTALDSTNSSNTATLLTGEGETAINGKTTLNSKVLESSGTSSKDGRTLQIYKYLSDGTNNITANAVKGVTFTVKNMTQDEKDITMITNKDGKGSASGLLLDNVYQVTETNAPSNITVNSDPYYIVFRSATGKTSYDPIDGHQVQVVDYSKGSYTLNVANTEKPGSVSVKKVAKDNPTQALSGAVFTLYKDEACSLSAGVMPATDENGEAVKTNVVPGTYYVKETTAPEGYNLNATVFKIDVTAGNQIAVGGDSVADEKIPATTVDLKAAKTVDDKTPSADEIFDFTLTPLSGAPGTTQTVKNKEGNVSFDTITFDQVGTYQYTVAESGSKVGYSYDTTTYTATVKVTVEEGKLKADVSYAIGDQSADAMTFNNKTVAPDATTATLSASKTVDDKTPSADESFDFTLTPVDGTPGTAQTVKNTNGTVNFNAITYDKEGTYTYTIAESGSKVGYSYDKTAYTAVVTVTKDGATNKLTASVVYKKGNTTVETAAFNNTTVAPTPASVSFNATKTVDNQTPADGETFDFKLTPGTGAPGTVQTVQNTKDAVNFDAITFDHEGTYNYTIAESGSKVGYSYDKTAYTAVVTITKNAETNQLEAAVEYKNGDDGVGAAAFNNTTVAPDATVINLSAKKTLNGGTPVAGETFKFTAHVTQKPDGVTLDDQTMTNNGGAVNFNGMSASQEGTYTFEITESGTAAGYALDTNVYTATVEVIKNVLTNKLECGPVVYQNQAGHKVEAAVFNNATIYPKVTVSKTDITGETEVAGAALSIKDKNGTVVESWTSTNTAHEVTSKLVPGETYTLHEDGAPAGYAYASDVTFTVNKEGADQKVIMVDKPVDVTISKKAITGDNELPGATLSVKDKKGNTVDQWVSTNEAHKIEASKLTAGATYTLHEEGAPDGYTYASDITFTVNKDGSAQTVTMIDKAIGLTISKQDITNSKELAGATLQIRDNDDNGAIVQDKNGNPLQWISGDTPKTIDTTNFKAGHVYVLVEIKAPAGYAIAESISFKIGDGNSDRGNCTIYTKAKNSETFKANDNQTVIMQDAVLPVNPTPSTPTTPTTPVEKTKSLAVSKQDITSGSELPGATLKIFDTATGKEVLDKDGNALEWISETTPKTIDTTNMTAGDTYMLVESQAPKGYQVAESIYFKLDQPKDSDQTSYDVYIRNGNEWTLADGQTVTMKDATKPDTPTPTTPTTPTTTPTTPSTPKLTTTVVTPTTPNAGTTTTTMTTGNQNATTVSNNGNANTGVHHNGYPIAAAALCVIAAIFVIAVDKRKKQH